MVAKPDGRGGDGGGVGSDDTPRRSIVHHLERPTRIGRRDHGLAGEERLVRPHPEVLVDRCVEGGKARRVQVLELLGRDAAGETHAARQPSLVDELLEARAVGPVTRHDDTERRLLRCGLEQQVDPLRAVEAADGQHEVPGAVVPVFEGLRWVRQHLGDESGGALEPARDVLRGGEEARRLAERDAVELLHLPPHRAILGRLAELAELGAVELVRLPELVDEPHALLRVANDVRGELGRHHHVDRAAVRLGQVEEPPEERLREHARARVPLERNRDDVRLVASRAQAPRRACR